MIRVGFTSDLHLDHLRSDGEIDDFIDHCNKVDVDILVITGDISNSQRLRGHLKRLDRNIKSKIAFVLGNHDFWFSSVAKVRSWISKIANDHLVYLTPVDSLKVSESTVIVGHDGWYDGRNGFGARSSFVMNDWQFTDEFIPARRQGFGQHNTETVVKVAQQLADHSASEIDRKITKALKDGFTNIIIATHVPPWDHAHVHKGSIGNAHAQPWFTSKIMGLCIGRIADENPGVNFTVLCGHTHGRTKVKVSHNLSCIVSGIDYGNPRIDDVLEVE